MRSPIAFIHGNCVFAESGKDAWAAFAVQTRSYQWLSDERKRAWLGRLTGALRALKADVQILRVERSFDCSARRSGKLVGSCPVVYLLASLSEPRHDVAAHVADLLDRSARRRRERWMPAMRANRRLLSVGELARLRELAAVAGARLAHFLHVRPARGEELQWLVRRAFCRGVGEPFVDRLHEPSALAFEHNGQAMLAPLEGDVVRWMDSYLEHRSRCLRVESECGESWQAFLVLGALPESVEFPGAAAELMFAPPESLPFAVDLSLNARFLPNGLAVRLTRRRLQDAEQIVQAESDGELGVSDHAYRRAQQARDLLTYLQESDRPPLLRATMTLAIGAGSEPQLAERIEECRRAYGEISLHRPLGDQLALFQQSLPGQRTRVSGYEDTLTLEQVGAMMPIATHRVGAEAGFPLGHTLTGSRRSIRFNLREGTERDRNAAILCVGALGSGKTTLAQKLAYEGFRQGARVIDCDPKGDHDLHLRADVAPRAETIALRPHDPAMRGVLDPLRVAPDHLRRDAAISFLCDLLPARADPRWETAVVAAVDRVARRSRTPTCSEVVDALLAGDSAEAEAGRAIAAHASSGLARLRFADGSSRVLPAGGRQFTYISIRDLPGPRPGTQRAEYTQAERIGIQIVRLIAMFAMQSMTSEPRRLKLFCFDEGWRLLGDPAGRMLLDSLQRMGRSELAVPIVSTQLVGDILLGERESLESLLGATFVFGMRSEAEAARALTLLGLDPDDRQARDLLLDMEAGRCLLRDHLGRIEAIQVAPLAPSETSRGCR